MGLLNIWYVNKVTLAAKYQVEAEIQSCPKWFHQCSRM